MQTVRHSRLKFTIQTWNTTTRVQIKRNGYITLRSVRWSVIQMIMQWPFSEAVQKPKRWRKRSQMPWKSSNGRENVLRGREKAQTIEKTFSNVMKKPKRWRKRSQRPWKSPNDGKNWAKLNGVCKCRKKQQSNKRTTQNGEEKSSIRRGTSGLEAWRSCFTAILALKMKRCRKETSRRTALWGLRPGTFHRAWGPKRWERSTVMSQRSSDK